MNTSRHHLLYIHPWGHLHDELVPMGVVAAMNRLQVPHLGRFSHEVTVDDIAEARCFALDLHWYHSLAPIAAIARDLKQMNPAAPLILGGITASFYAAELMQRLPIDYLVQGDAEPSFQRLVTAIFDGERTVKLPNVWSQRWGCPKRSCVAEQEYDANDYLDLSWFPSLERMTFAAHAAYRQSPVAGGIDSHHPYIPLNRGCSFDCPGCFGDYQHEVFGPGQVNRSPESLARLLDNIEQHPHYHFVSLAGGTEDSSRWDLYASVFRRQRALGACVMHFCDLPTDASLELLLGGFESLSLEFTNPSDALPLNTKFPTLAAAEDRIIEIARALDDRPDCRIGISFISPGTQPFCDRLLSEEFARVHIKRNAEWSLPRPGFGELTTATDAPRRQVAHARSQQLDRLQWCSQGHANYLAARVLAPDLKPILDPPNPESEAVHPPALKGFEPTELEAFSTWYQQTLGAWFVGVIPRLRVSMDWLRLEGQAPGIAPLRPPASAWSTLSEKASLTKGLHGVQLNWNGSPPDSCLGEGWAVAIVPRFGWKKNEWLTARNMTLYVVSLPPLTANCRIQVDGRFAPLENRISVQLQEGHSRPIRYELDPLQASARASTPEVRHGASEPGPVADVVFTDPRLPLLLLKVVTHALRLDRFPGWRGTLVQQTESQVVYRFSSTEGGHLETYLLPIGSHGGGLCTRRFELIYRESIEGLAARPQTRLLLRRLLRLLRHLDDVK